MEFNFKVLVAINVIIGIVSFIGLVLSSIVHLSERFINQKHDHPDDSSLESQVQSLASSGPRYKGTAAFTNFQSNPQGTWTGAGITATYGAISNPSGYGSFQFTFTMAHNYGDTDSYLILAQGHFHNAGVAGGRSQPLVVNIEKINGTTFIGTVADITTITADDAKFDLFVFDA